MKHSALVIVVGTISLIATLTVSAPCQEPGSAGAKKAGNTVVQSVQKGTTMDNVQTAYYAESSAGALYAAYAKKADEEGYHQLASMFRAVARGEEVHAANCAALIREAGGAPEPHSDPVVVMSTRKNLEAADTAQVYETDVMYPEFVKQANKEKNKAAAHVFTFAMAAEPAHHALFQQALKDLDGYRGDNVQFLVCPTCGYAVRTLGASACPVCSTPKDKFEKVR